MHPKELAIKDFTYTLPDQRIAHYPLAERDQSKLLIWKGGRIEADRYANLANHIPPNSLLVFNNTRVVAARLLFKKPNGGVIEIFCLEPPEQYGDITSAMLEKGEVTWKCLVGGAKKWKEGALTEKVQRHGLSEIILSAQKIEQRNDYYLIRLSWDDTTLSFAEILQLAGLIPLPPYLNRVPDASDTDRYQTIYARHDGSVAAPTAGLHFTEAVFEKLKAKSIQHDFITLHVGAGTFKPVKSETMQLHDMHAEFIEIRSGFIENILDYLGKPIIAVGTTSLRTLESLYWLGIRIKKNPFLDAADLLVGQWDPYAQETNLSAAEALRYVLDWMKQRGTEKLIAKTQIIIAPGYRFRIVQALVTNFHQPQSTLLLLVAAITGDDWRKIYAYAMDNDFRFLSYGDGNLLWLR